MELGFQKKQHERMLQRLAEANRTADWYQKEATEKAEGLDRVVTTLQALRDELAYVKWISRRATERRDQAEAKLSCAEKEITAAQRQLEQVTSENRAEVLRTSARATINQLKVMAAERRLAESELENQALRVQHASVLLSRKGMAEDDDLRRELAEADRNVQSAFVKENALKRQIDHLHNSMEAMVESATAERTQQLAKELLRATSRKGKKRVRSMVAEQAGGASLQHVQQVWRMKPPGKVER